MRALESASEDELVGYIENLKKVISLGDALKRLQNNADWKLIISSVYCQEYLHQLMAWSIQTHLTDEERKGILAEAQGPAYLLQFIKSQKDNAAKAKDDLARAEQVLVEIRNEESE